MKNTLNDSMNKIQRDHRNIRRYLAIFFILAIGTFLAVNWRLRRTGISMTADYQCGYAKEHTHTDACYENVLICGQEETDGREGHTHTEACYEEKSILICEKQEHTHTGTCYDEEGNLICEMEEHVHGEACVQMEKELVCGQEESETVPEHHHTEECYEKVLVCTVPEHVHSVECLIDENADVETAADWEQTIPDTLTENWTENMVLVARSQIGYRESQKNFQLAEDGTTRRGYTRYGAWYGNEYGDWCAMFASFCIRYAGIPSEKMPVNSGCAAWVSELKSVGLYREKQTAEPRKGELVFFDLDQDQSADHVGIIERTDTGEDGSVFAITVIEGNSSDEVKENTYDGNHAAILGYGLLPEEPDKTADIEEDSLESAKETVEMEPADDSETKTVPLEETRTPMDRQNTKLFGSGTKYDAEKNQYSSDLQVDFTFQTEEVKTIGYAYSYTYPDGIQIPDGLLDGKDHDLYDASGVKAGTYRFEKTEDGTYKLLIDLDSSYVEKAGDTISGFVRFSGQIAGTKADEEGNIKITGTDDVILEIPKDKITYPENETNNYDIKTQKSGSYQVKDGKLIYTVYVTSTKGTPSAIDFQDTITVEGMTLGTPDLTITKEKVPRYYNEDGSWWDSTQIIEEQMETPEYSYENGKIQMTLPQIDGMEDKTDASGTGYKEYTRYKIVYTYDVSGLETEQPKADNTVSAKSKNEKNEVKSSSSADVTISNRHSLEKTGYFDTAANQIVWKIIVNQHGMDLAGGTLRDEMLARLAEGTDITIEPSNGYEIVKDDNGKITQITFTAEEGEKNTNTYTITYRTAAEPSWDSQVISNEADFEPGDGSREIKKTGSVTIGGGEIAKSVGTLQEAADRKTGILPWKVTLTVPESGILKGTTIVDDPTKNQWGGTGGKNYLTREQVLAWTEGIYWADADGNRMETTEENTTENTTEDVTDDSGSNFNISDVAEIRWKASDGNTYSMEEIRESTGESLVYSVCTITLNKDITVPKGAKKLIFDYKTTIDLENAGVGTNYYYNDIKIGEKEVSAAYTYEKGGVVKTDENGNKETTSKSNADGTLIWKVTVTLAEKSSQLFLCDTLPEGVTLTGLEGEGKLSGLKDLIMGEDSSVSGESDICRIQGTCENQQLKVTLTRKNPETSLDAGVYTLVVKCKVNPEKLDAYETGKTYTFANHVTASDEKGSLGSADQTQNWTEDKSSADGKVVDKTGKWDNDSRRVKYSIALNPDGKDLVEGSDVLTLTDTMKYLSKMYVRPRENWDDIKTIDLRAWLIPDSVRLYWAVKQENGTLTKKEEIKNWTWTVKTSTWKQDWEPIATNQSVIEAKQIPDETPLILEYDYQFEADVPDGYIGSVNLNVSNTAQLEGTSYKDEETQYDTEWKDQTHTGQVTTEKRYTIYKVGKGDYANTLPGAVFRLQKYNGITYETMEQEYTTDQNGKLILEWQKTADDPVYEKNVLYRLVEKEAPKGYLLPEDPEKAAIYFYFGDSSDTTHTLPETLPAEAVDLTQISQIAYIENEEDQTPAYELPESGGSGTIPFTVGGITMIGAVLLYGFSSKRSSTKRRGE